MSGKNPNIRGEGQVCMVFEPHYGPLILSVAASERETPVLQDWMQQELDILKNFRFKVGNFLYLKKNFCCKLKEFKTSFNTNRMLIAR